MITNDDVMEILDIDIETFKKCRKKINEIDAWYIWNPARGGKSVIIDSRGEKLVANSSVSFNKHLQDFKGGKRN